MKANFDFDTFLSYCSSDREAVLALATSLRAAGLKVWFDEWIVRAGDDIYLTIEKGLEASRTLILCMSPAAFSSDWVSMERNTALFRDPNNTERRFLPLLLTDTEIPETLRRYKYIDWRERAEGALKDLVAMIASRTRHQEMTDRGHRHEEVLYDSHTRQLLAFLERELRSGIFRVHGKDLLQLPSLSSQEIAEPSAFFPRAYVSRLPRLRGDEPESELYSSLASVFEKRGAPLVIIGPPGSGKTTTLLTFARSLILADKNDEIRPIPAFLPIDSWSEGEDLAAWIERVTALPTALVRLDDPGSPLILLLDGLDELAGEWLRLSFLRNLESVVRLPWMLTCRAEEFEQLKEASAIKVPVFEISALTRDQVLGYVKEVIAEEVQADQSFAALLQTPLLLALFCSAMADDPSDVSAMKGGGRREIFSSEHLAGLFVRRRIEYESRRADYLDNYSISAIYLILGQLASSMVNRASNRTSFTGEDFAHLVQHSPSEFAALMCRMQLLSTDDGGRYRFKHLLLRDHFAIHNAKAMLRANDDFDRGMAVQALCQIGSHDALHEVVGFIEDDSAFEDEFLLQSILMAIGRGGDTRALKSLIERIPVLFKMSDMVGVYLASALGSLGARYPDVFVDFLYHPNKAIKDCVGGIAEGIITEDQIPRLLHALEDGNRDTRWWAGRLLPKFGSAVTNWIVPYIKHPSPQVRAIALQILGEVRAQDGSIGAAIEALSDYEDEVRAAAVTALGQIGTSDSWLPLLTVSEDGSAVVRVAVAIGLVQSSHPSAFSHLSKACNDPVSEVRAAVATSFGKLGDARAVPMLTGFLNDQDESVVKSAAEALEELKAEESASPLLRALEKYGESPTACTICKALRALAADPQICENIIAKHTVTTDQS